MKDYNLKVYLVMPIDYAHIEDDFINELDELKESFVEHSNRNYVDDGSHAPATIEDFDFIVGYRMFSENEKPLEYLGDSLKALANADLCVFAPGWRKVAHCKIEHECCKLYGIPILYMN